MRKLNLKKKKEKKLLSKIQNKSMLCLTGKDK